MFVDDLQSLDDDLDGIEVDELDDYRDVWGFVRSVAHGWPLPTAPRHIHDTYEEALRTVAERMLAIRERDIAVC